MVIWLIGLSGSGKTTIGGPLTDLIRSEERTVVFLDGDDFREIMGGDLGHTLDDRRRNADRISRLCRFLDAQGVDVVCAILSLFEESRRWNREHIADYFEVFLDVPLETVIERDAKGLYARALAGELADVAGIDIEFPTPERPDMVIGNDGDRDPEDVAREIHGVVVKRREERR